MKSRYLLSFLVSMFALALVGCGRSDIGELDDSPIDASIDGSRKDGGVDAGDGGKDSGGDGGPCLTALDCDDNIACTQDFCSNGRCQHRPLDQDNDGFIAQTCGGNDCNDLDPRIHPGARENCTNKIDDNCNGLVDCADPDCRGQPGCACGPKEICGNGIDDDCNGLTDCKDPACASDPRCTNCGPVEICNNGKDDDCNGLTDCQDPACASDPSCTCRGPEICNNGIDDNCDGRIDCDDPQCASDQGCICRRTPENCSNGKDDNCNGLVDCADPACNGTFECSCNGRAPQPEICNDHIDNDCNGKVDCADSACIGSPFCTQCRQEICDNGIDDDCNGLVDCADPACVFAPNCKPVAEICDNGIDDDHNGLTDCYDPACKTNPRCILRHENCLTAKQITASGTYTGDTTGFINNSTGSCGGAAGEAVFYLTLTQPSKVHLDTRGSRFDSVLYVRAGACKAGRELACDDDSGGNHAALIDFTLLTPGNYFIYVDGFTVDPQNGPDQGPYALNVNITANPPEICDNGIDDDGNQLVDCADPACTNVGRCLNCNGGRPPTAEFGVGACTDGQDNDCDGKVDCADSDCHASAYYTTECCNGRDDNGNGIIDEYACKCADDSTCARGRGDLCYTHTAYSCGPPCTRVIGDICPYVAGGSTCSQQTTQCEYPAP